MTLPDLLPDDPGGRKELFDRVLRVTTAAGPPSETRRARLRDLAERFGLGAEYAVESRTLKVVTKKRPAPARPARRTPSARTPRRGGATGG
jgi:hypothetical protein